MIDEARRLEILVDALILASECAHRERGLPLPPPITITLIREEATKRMRSAAKMPLPVEYQNLSEDELREMFRQRFLPAARSMFNN